ncbi:hypothetical protein KY285_018112 [Solanum tuberosum]|nr:hypothetical protein KY284_018102 [Solanum tuberosum]KAH0703834.1 hypothetical protein KY285_018112 [Solanum tuberosum]
MEDDMSGYAKNQGKIRLCRKIRADNTKHPSPSDIIFEGKVYEKPIQASSLYEHYNHTTTKIYKFLKQLR